VAAVGNRMTSPMSPSSRALTRSPRSWAWPHAESGVRPYACRARSTTRARADSPVCLTDIARRTGVSGYPGDGAQRWPAVHALDAAVLSGWPWSRRKPGPPGTPWPTRATRCATSPRSSGDDWTCLSSRCQRKPTALSARSSPPTSPHPVPTPGRRSAGSRSTRASWTTWRTSNPDDNRQQQAGPLPALAPAAEDPLPRGGLLVLRCLPEAAGRSPGSASPQPSEGDGSPPSPPRPTRPDHLGLRFRLPPPGQLSAVADIVALTNGPSTGLFQHRRHH
jgi:hypothetical protein